MATNALTASHTQINATTASVWRGLLLHEWWAHRPLLVILGHAYAFSPIVAMLAGALGMTRFNPDQLVEQVLFSARAWVWVAWEWTYWMGIGLALIAGLFLGGAETTAGLEEGSLSLPATRHQRFWARFWFAGGLVIAHELLCSLAFIARSVWLTRPPLGGTPISDWLLISVITPLVVFALAWTAAVNGGPRRKLLLAICGIGLLYLTTVMRGLVTMFGYVPGDIANVAGTSMDELIPLILPAWSLWMLHLAYRIYCTREIHALQDN